MDNQRNVAVTLGERDVKADVKAKNKYVCLLFYVQPLSQLGGIVITSTIIQHNLFRHIIS